MSKNVKDSNLDKIANIDGSLKKNSSNQQNQQQSVLPSLSLPKGGGAIRGIGEKFTANKLTGTGSLTVPIYTSPGRSGFNPQLQLSYDSGFGNGPFGYGWNLSLPSITRKTDKGLPRYKDDDVFILSGAEDLVPVFKKDQNDNWIRDSRGNLVFDSEERDGYVVRSYRPRIEGLFARIERWTSKNDGNSYWRSISKDNVSTMYGKTADRVLFNFDTMKEAMSFFSLIKPIRFSKSTSGFSASAGKTAGFVDVTISSLKIG